ncbi:ATP-dependent RecD-like DNA helicase [Mesorhizobium sp. SP-1A]|uniref:SF1B family DNA helicase RecD2 n=1 Tax=Mesorhizobium sp. SP-1A TaxID=3077840 RepID=UPI0028F6F782|nr:ATP-dependent RecD-like DNA helicase [Mesorhizobium sp. SP-1A]
MHFKRPPAEAFSYKNKASGVTSKASTPNNLGNNQGDLFGAAPKPASTGFSRPNSSSGFGLKKSLQPEQHEDISLPQAPVAKVHASQPVAPAEPTLQEVVGRVERVIYETSDGYAVYSVKIDGGKSTTVAVTSNIKAKRGDRIVAKGQWSQYKGKETFKAAIFMMEIAKGAKGVVAWLKMGSVPGVGKSTAEKIAKFFGDAILEAVVDPNELVKSGIPMRRAEAIAEAWNSNAAQPELIEFLGRFGLGEMTIAKIIKRYGAAARRVIQTRPWELAETIDGIGFATADEIALDAGHAKDSPARLNSGVRYALDQKTGREGHCGLTMEALVGEARRLLQVDEALIEEAIITVVKEGGIVDDKVTGLLYTEGLYQAESRLAKRLLDMVKSGPRIPEELARKVVEEAVVELKVNRDDSQVNAAVMAVMNPISIITGGPGTGKSTTQKVIVHAIEKLEQETILAAPTGRAAKRLYEASGHPASTCHRLLSFSADKGGFEYDASNPFPEDRIIIDEFSMVDIRLGQAFMDAVSVHAAVTIVGDVDQLPSVGAGQVLRDLIESGVIPVARLQTVHRQSGDSGIVVAAANINAGEHPLNGRDDLNGFEVFSDAKAVGDPESFAKTVVDFMSVKVKELGFDPISDVQVLSPMRVGDLGILALNQKLKEALNPSSNAKTVEIRKREFSVGDRVMHLKNDYVKKVYNGEVGTILRVGKRPNKDNNEEPYLVVDYSGFEAFYGPDDIHDIELAWAATVHKSQGCEFPVVIFVCPWAHKHMLTRNLIYTAVTRAKKLCIVVGHDQAVLHSVRTTEANERFTGLSARLKEGKQAA